MVLMEMMTIEKDGGGDDIDGEDTLLVCVDAKGNARWCFTFLLSGSTLDSISAS